MSRPRFKSQCYHTFAQSKLIIVMTPQHIIYIPTIFLVGFVMGLMVGEKKLSDTEHSKTFQQKNAGKRMIYTLSLFAIAFIITHIFELPFNSKNVSRLLGNQEIFDKSPVFTSDDVYRKISTFSLEGIEAYKRFSYTTDLVFPISFLIFLLAFQRYLSYRSGNIPIKWTILRSLPYMWFSLDLLENLLVFIILNCYPAKHNVLAGSLGIITVLKFSFLFSALAVPIAGYIYSKFKIING